MPKVCMSLSSKVRYIIYQQAKLCTHFFSNSVEHVRRAVGNRLLRCLEQGSTFSSVLLEVKLLRLSTGLSFLLL